MRFFRQQPAYLIVSLCFLAASWSLWSCQTSKSPDSTATLTSEERARQVLTEILGKDSFQVFLTTDSRLVLSRVEKKDYGDSVIEAEQNKVETLDHVPDRSNLESYQSDTNKDNSRRYHYEVSSRNYLVAEKYTYEIVTRTEVSQIRCLVVVKKDASSKVDIARSALTTLLGIDLKRGDTLAFEVEN